MGGSPDVGANLGDENTYEDSQLILGIGIVGFESFLDPLIGFADVGSVCEGGSGAIEPSCGRNLTIDVLVKGGKTDGARVPGSATVVLFSGLGSLSEMEGKDVFVIGVAMKPSREGWRSRLTEGSPSID